MPTFITILLYSEFTRQEIHVQQIHCISISMCTREHKNINDVASFQSLGYTNKQMHRRRKCMPFYIKSYNIISVSLFITIFVIVNAQDKRNMKKYSLDIKNYVNKRT